MSTTIEINTILEQGIDVANRRIYFGDTSNNSGGESHYFNQRSVELAVRALHILVSKDSTKPIELHMDSPGGDIYSMLRLCDEIINCPCPVKFIGGGMVMSAATWVMAVCDERYLQPNTTVLIHNGWDGTEGSHNEVLIQTAEFKRLRDVLHSIYTNNSNMPKTFWEKACKQDLYLSAEEAISLGLADQIIQPKDRTAFRKLRNKIHKKQTPEKLQELADRLYARIEDI